MSGYTAHSDELPVTKGLALWLKLAKERHIELGNKIENFDLGDIAMAYLSLGSAIDKAIECAWADESETETNKR